jgi:2-oxoglutarate dehydrogenase E2 component (dihydrolipoamide succinyltransferase)
MVEIATDKVDSEVPAPEAGILIETLVNDGDVVKVGQPIAHIGTAADAQSSCATAAVAPMEPRKRWPAPWPLPISSPLQLLRALSVAPAQRKVLQSRWCATSPRAKGWAWRVGGDRRHGRGWSRDQEGHPGLSARGAAQAAPTPAPSSSGSSGSDRPATRCEAEPQAGWLARRRDDRDGPHAQVDRRPHGDEQAHQPARHQLRGSRRDQPVLWREKVKKAFEKREGEKLTFTPIFIMAIVQAIKEMPMINVQVDGHTIIKKEGHQHRHGRGAAQRQPHRAGDQERRSLNLVGLAKGERPGQPGACGQTGPTRSVAARTPSPTWAPSATCWERPSSTSPRWRSWPPAPSARNRR